MRFDLNTVELDRLDSLTKYPSIPTYHAFDASKGGLQDKAVAFDGPALLTEKVDGTNARIVATPDGRYVLGSRTQLLYARGDLIGNPAMGIVEHLKPLAERVVTELPFDGVRVFYGELYGGKITAHSKQYTGAQGVGFRLFDVVEVPDVEAKLSMGPEALARWRDGGGQTFVDEAALTGFATALDVALTPRLGKVEALPSSLDEGLAFLEAWIPETRVALDDGAGGRPEGLVARTADRGTIAKLRYDDYRKTLRRRAKGGR